MHGEHDHSYGPGHVHGGPTTAATSRKLRLALALTLAFVLLEGGAGLFAQSLALVSDAGHNLADALALGLTLWTFGLVGRPSTAVRTFGLHRAGILAALVNAAALVVIALGIFVEAYQRLLAPVPVAAGVMTIVAVLALAINLTIARGLHAAAHQDLNVRASFVHVAGDAASAAGVVLAGALIALTGQSWLDPIVSILIGGFILWTSRGIIAEAVNVLLEATPADLDAHVVQETMSTVPGVLDVHDLHLWSVSSSVRAASAHILVEDQPVSRACQILGDVNATLAEKFRITHTSLQLETTACDPGEVFCQLDAAVSSRSGRARE